MKLSAAFALLTDLALGIRVAVGPTCHAILASPSLLFQPMAIRRILMAHIWHVFADLVDQGGRPIKRSLLTQYAYGAVLDIGAGHGHTAMYLDKSRVTRYIALEPNTLMHPKIRAMANASGFDEPSGTLIILGCGAEDTNAIISGLDPLGGGGRSEQYSTVDTIVSVLTLCSVPSPQTCLRSLVDHVLRPAGGQFLFYEHVLSDREDVAWWQRFWTPVWKMVFDGCRLDRPTHRWFEEMGVGADGMWSNGELWGKQDEPEEHLFWHRVGRFVKA